MLTYSIAIRTLGTAGNKFREELLSITRQTVQPERVMVYIAEGHQRPDFTIGREQYVWVKKGMVAQRVLPYKEISSDCILMLDDDVRLAPDSAERMLRAMEENEADCVGADTFKNQDMPFTVKAYAVITNLVFPHYSKRWAFKIHLNGSFSYNNRPVKPFYWSQKCDGPAMMWRRQVFLSLRFEDELWLDSLGFAYGDDTILSYKAYVNGYRLGLLYDSGMEHLDGKASSGNFRNNPQWMFVRTKAQFIIWWRTCYKRYERYVPSGVFTALCFIVKTLWVFAVIVLAGLVTRRLNLIALYLKGIRAGWMYVHSEQYYTCGNYIVKR